MIDRKKFLEIYAKGETELGRIPWNKVAGIIQEQFTQQPFTITMLLNACKAQGIEVSRIRLFAWLKEQAGIIRKKHPKVLVELFAAKYMGTWYFYYTPDPEEKARLRNL